MARWLTTVAELRAVDGQSRLRLQNALGEDGQDFHSLLLERLAGDAWISETCLTRDDFQGHHLRECWVSDLHSFTPTTSQAIIKVAEGDQPIGAWSISYGYSWRRWDLASNRELARLRDCSFPAERF